LLAARAEMGRAAVALDWWWRMPVESGFTELWLAKGDLAQAHPQAETFLTAALATVEHTWQALAWEANARVAMAAQAWNRAEECIANALSAIEGFEVPLAAWRVHGTAAELYARAGDGDSAQHPAAEHQRELSRTTILKLANSLAAEEPLRKTFLSAPAVQQIIGADIGLRVKRA